MKGIKSEEMEGKKVRKLRNKVKEVEKRWDMRERKKKEK